MKGGLLLDVVIRKGTAVLELLSSENKTLLIRWDSLLVLNLALNVVDGIRRLHLKGDGLASHCEDVSTMLNEGGVMFQAAADKGYSQVLTKICMIAV